MHYGANVGRYVGVRVAKKKLILNRCQIQLLFPKKLYGHCSTGLLSRLRGNEDLFTSLQLTPKQDLLLLLLPTQNVTLMIEGALLLLLARSLPSLLCTRTNTT